jgi:hypothetical protein
VGSFLMFWRSIEDSRELLEAISERGKERTFLAS